MNRNFPCAYYDMEFEDVREWAERRETAVPVAVAISAIADICAMEASLAARTAPCRRALSAASPIS